MTVITFVVLLSYKLWAIFHSPVDKALSFLSVLRTSWILSPIFNFVLSTKCYKLIFLNTNWSMFSFHHLVFFVMFSYVFKANGYVTFLSFKFNLCLKRNAVDLSFRLSQPVPYIECFSRNCYGLIFRMNCQWKNGSRNGLYCIRPLFSFWHHVVLFWIPVKANNQICLKGRLNSYILMDVIVFDKSILHSSWSIHSKKYVCHNKIMYIQTTLY